MDAISEIFKILKYKSQSEQYSKRTSYPPAFKYTFFRYIIVPWVNGTVVFNLSTVSTFFGGEYLVLLPLSLLTSNPEPTAPIFPFSFRKLYCVDSLFSYEISPAPCIAT